MANAGRGICLRLRIACCRRSASSPALAQAHPHVWVDAAAEVLFDDKGQIAAIRHHWRFDEGFSAYALQGLDTDRDGEYSPEELAAARARRMSSRSKDFDFFTFLSVGDYQAGFAAPTDYQLDLMDDRLIAALHAAARAAASDARTAVLLEVYDPEYYVAFSLPSIEAVRLVDAPPACRLAVHPAQEPDAAAAAALADDRPGPARAAAGHAGADRRHREQRRDELRRAGRGAGGRRRRGCGDGG